jgi:hypothetical protein
MRYLLCPLLAYVTLAACAAETLPIEASICDGARLQQRWADSIYAVIWNDPLLDEARAEFDRKMTELGAEEGYDVLALLKSLESAGFRFVGMKQKNGKSEPEILIQSTFTQLTPEIFTAWQMGAGKPASLVTADAAFTLDDDPAFMAARFGTTVVAGNSTIEEWAIANDDFDLRFEMDVAKFMAMAAEKAFEQVPEPERLANHAEFDARLRLMPPSAKYDLSLVREGMLERIAVPMPAGHFKAVDVAVLDRLPATTLIAAGIGLDGKAIWQQYRTVLLSELGKTMMDGESAPDDVAAMLDMQLSELGITTPIDGLIENVNGTAVFAVLPGAPFPTMNILIPQSPGLEQVLAFALSKIPSAQPLALPAPGASLMLPIPNVFIPVLLTRDANHWLLTTDMAFAQQWSAGSTGGWSQSEAGKLALAKAPADAYVIASSDTPAVLRTVSPFLSLGLNQTQMEENQKMQTLQLIDKVAGMASTGYSVTGIVNGIAVCEQRGLFGSTMMGAVVAGMALPAVALIRKNARAAPAPVPEEPAEGF